jgi:hypothetical protein
MKKSHHLIMEPTGQGERGFWEPKVGKGGTQS